MSIKTVVICGPTASGKTALAVSLAKYADGEIVSADSMQIYKGMDIGTAKVTHDEMQGVPHHMIDIVSPAENYSTGRYVSEAAEIMADIHGRGKIPFVAGGTGMYIDNLIGGTRFGAPAADKNIRKRLMGIFDEKGGEQMLAELARFDESTANRLHPNDKKRIVRAFEVYEMTGKPISVWDSESKLVESPYEAVYIGLKTEDRAVLYDRINKRVDMMFDKGLVGEVERLLGDGVPSDCTAMQAIGYKEIVSALSGECSLDEAREAIKQNSRRYAKRQLTWFRRNKKINWFDTDKTDIEEIYNICQKLAGFAK